ncbi:MAG: heme ABC exporter ATP-binding protein CcmA [Geminicoccaceae bacterium]|nr:heme ABC exporter ATP-binding protein CcmA [Geminicoccaceae bacterium]
MPAPDATREAAAPLLEAAGLACRRGGRLLLEAVDWRLAPGDALLLKGANGSGKSSLLRLLAGFLRPAGGRLLHGGRDVFADLARYRAALHHLGYQDALKPALTVAENLEAAAALLGGERGRLAAALDAFALGGLAATPVRFLSSGQRRRAALARLAAVPRPIWLLDEPGIGLDRRNRDALEALIDRHRGGGGIAVVASHGDVALARPLVLDLDGAGA